MPTLNIAPYDLVVTAPDGATVYPIKDALLTVLFSQQGLRARDLLRRDDIGRKILAADTTLDLTDEELTLLKATFETAEGFGRNDIELVRRVLDLQ